MNRENDEPWSAEEVEEWEHDQWLKIQEMGDEAYMKVEEEDEMEEDPYEEEERRRWQEEEERAKEAYFQEIKEEEERGVYRQTVAELIEERSAARKLMKKMKKEKEEINANSEKPEKYEQETEVSTENEDKVDSSDPPLQPLDSPTSQPSDSPTEIDASIQETNLNNSQAVVETQMGEESESTQEKDGGLQMGDTGQVTEYYLKEEEVRRRREEEEEEEKKIPTSKVNKLWKWWRNMWTAHQGIFSPMT